MTSKMKKFILDLMKQHNIMTVATIRNDGYPQATTVVYVNDGLTLYFAADNDSQKAKNIKRCDMDEQPDPSTMAIISVTPKVISVINYTLGFGHTDLVKV